MAILLFMLGVVLGVVSGALFMMYRQQQRQAEEAAASSSKSPDLLRISQRAIGYPLLIEIEGARYWSVSEIVESDHRALLFAAARTLLAQIPREHLEAVMPPSTEAEAAGPPPPPSAHVARPPTPAPAPPSIPPASTPVRPSSSLSTVMIKEIDELFQAILQTMPDAPEAGLMAAADGSMLIKVGSQYYRSVDEIAHPQVRQALRQAIKQWEARL